MSMFSHVSVKWFLERYDIGNVGNTGLHSRCERQSAPQSPYP